MDSDGQVYISGSFTGTVERGDFPVTATGNYPVTGFDAKDVFAAKLDGDGQFRWGQGMGGDYWDAGSRIEFSADGSIYVTGQFGEGIASFGTFQLVNAGDDIDALTAKLSRADGTLIWANRFGGIPGGLLPSGHLAPCKPPAPPSFSLKFAEPHPRRRQPGCEW